MARNSEAAEIGHSWEFMAEAMMNDPTGLTMPVALEELGAMLALIINHGERLAAAGIAASGTPEQVMEWVPQCYGTSDQLMLGAAPSEPDAGSDVAAMRTERCMTNLPTNGYSTAPRPGLPTVV